MSVQFETISALFQASGVGPSVTVPAPSGLVAGELLVAIGAVFGEPAVITLPGGWTKDDEVSVPGAATGFVASKKAAASDIGANFLFSQDLGGSEAWTIGIYRLSSASAVDSFRPAFVGGTSTTITLPLVTTVADNVLILRAIQMVYSIAEPTSISDPGPGDHTRRAFIGGPNVAGAANPFAVYYTDDVIKTPPGTDSAPLPKAIANGASGNKDTAHYAVGIAPLLPGSGSLNQALQDKSGKIITKAEVLAARSHAIKIGAKVKTKFDQRRR